jgi:hypothetical protein
LLDDAVAAYLDAVGEREFDEPLLALIRSRGYTDVHLTHGAREFGKDVVAKLSDEQWVWQSKVGDINHTEWRKIVEQLGELRLTNLGHGALDTSLPRRAVLVTTGRLTGNAPDLFRDYNERARQRSEPTLELWDRDTLLGDLSGNNDAILRGSSDGQLIAALGSIEEERTTMRSLETFSQRWMTWDEPRLTGLGVIEAALLCDRLHHADRLDLACHLALCLVRGTRSAVAGGKSPAVGAATRLFEVYARRLWAECDDRLLDRRALTGFSGVAGWVTYPARCARLAELLGLLALRMRASGDTEWVAVADWTAAFVAAQPGTSRPIGDEYAVGLIPTALALALRRRDAAERFLADVTVWLCDVHEKHWFGVAHVDADAREVVDQLLGAPFQHVELQKRRDSRIAAVVLDLCAALGMTGLYTDAFNDLAAVRVSPSVLRLAPGPSMWSRTGNDNRIDPNVSYAEVLGPETAGARHHDDVAGKEICEAGDAWDLLAVSSALRDRHFYRALSATLSTGTGAPAR